jgi:transcriptional regulator with XRE-family HTH domain
MMRLYRTVRGVSLRDLADVTGISHSTLMRIETGQSMDANTLLILWRWLLSTGPAPPTMD